MWQEFREALWNHELKKPLLYQPIDHPEFNGWEVVQPCVERMRMIRESRGPAHKSPGIYSMVDFGCHTGWFCRQFAKDGWKTTGVEKSAIHVEIARAVDEWAGVKTEYFVGNLLNFPIPKADVALCLSVAMYLFEDLDRGWDFFNRISQNISQLYLDFGGMYANRLPFTRETVVDQMFKHTAYKIGIPLGTTGFENRPMFLFEKHGKGSK